MKKHILIFVTLFLLLNTFGFAMENSDRTMTSGSFGVAWLNENGIICVYDGKTVLDSVPNVKTYAILAGDLMEDGEDQLIYLDDARKSLNLYRFAQKEVIGPFGHNVSTMALGQCSRDEKFPSLVVCTFSGDSFRWTKNVMGAGWIDVSGEFSHISGGNLDRQSTLDDFAVTNAGSLYVYSTKWQTYSTITDDVNAVAVIVGNLTEAPGDEIVFLDKNGSIFLCQNRKLENLAQKAKCLAYGKNGDALDTLYALDPGGKVAAYDRKANSWKPVFMGDVSAFTSIVTKTSDDGKGHSLFAVSEGNLYSLANGKAEKLSSEKPIAMTLSFNGKSVAEYRFDSVPFKPYIQVLRTPAGRNVLRDAPWDHLHHHALMFAISADGCDFWGEFDDNRGTQKMQRLSPQPGTPTDVLETEIDWNLPGGKNVLKETRKIRVLQTDDVTLLDWETTLKSDQAVKLGGDHYYGLGLRFDESMDKDGRFFNDTGKHDGEIVRGDERLKKCRWSAYTAKLDGKPVTVAVFDNPVTPIPMLAFTMGDSGQSFAYLSATMNLHRAAVTLQAGQPMTFSYRVAVLEGEVSPETIEKVYMGY